MDQATISWIWQRLKPYRVELAGSGLLSVLSAVLPAIDPLLLRRLIDTALPQHQLLKSLLLITGIAGCFIGTAVALLASMYLIFCAQQAMGQRMRGEMMEHLTRLPCSYHESNSPGETLVKLESDVDQICESGSGILAGLTRASLLLFANVAILFHLSTLLALALLPPLVLFFWTRRRFHPLLQERSREAQAESGKNTAALAEFLSGMPQLQLLCAERQVIESTLSSWSRVLKSRTRRQKTELLYSGVVHTVLGISGLLVLAAGAQQVNSGSLSLGSLIAVYAYALRTFEPLSSILETVAKLGRVTASVARVRTLFEHVPQWCGPAFTLGPPGDRGAAIEFRDVTFFHFPERRGVEDVSFCIAAGERVGVQGPSGSGKSTIARLLVRQLEPLRGLIMLDGRPVQEYSLSRLRQAICYVPQNPVLFAGSLRQNLTYGLPPSSPSELNRVLAVARLDALLEGLPSGLDTELGAAGHSLSGGERQRVALARALLRRPEVLVLDESTSALDELMEEQIMQDLERFCPNSTLLVVSHSAHLMQRLERVITVNSGRITDTAVLIDAERSRCQATERSTELR